jgi:cell fate (sporulation/competence/biofilm development) regulator YlbF (YheA/YmcA/DUF963 family)
MDILNKARELGALIQNDSIYKELTAAREKTENDKVLQDKINEFNLIRLDIDNEIMKPERSDERLKSLNEKLQNLYSEITEAPAMVSFNKAKNEADGLLNKIYALLAAAFNGENPETFDVESACSGDCGSCGGCH